MSDPTEATLKASISEAITIKLRMVRYFFSNTKPAKNDTYSWQMAYAQSFTGNRNGAHPDLT